jgi:hypothetical protein
MVAVAVSKYKTVHSGSKQTVTPGLQRCSSTSDSSLPSGAVNSSSEAALQSSNVQISLSKK